MKYNITNNLGAIRFALITIGNVTVIKRNQIVWEHIEEILRSLRRKYNLKNIQEIKTISSVREMFKKEGMDPARYRPSSEALLRRVLQGQSLYQVNSIVDVNNWCSLEFFLPMGVYDTDNIVGNALIFRPRFLTSRRAKNSLPSNSHPFFARLFRADGRDEAAMPSCLR